MALSKIVSAIALLITCQFPANAQVPTSPDAVSATKARDIGGYELGMTIGEVRSRMTLSHIAGETFAGTDGGISYEIGFTPQGRIFRIHSVQKLGVFSPDASFAQTLSDKLEAKDGPPQNNELLGGTMRWEIIEPVQYSSGQKLPYRTMWMKISHGACRLPFKNSWTSFRRYPRHQQALLNRRAFSKWQGLLAKMGSKLYQDIAASRADRTWDAFAQVLILRRA